MPTQLTSLSSAELKKAAALQADIEVLQAKLASLLGGNAPSRSGVSRKGRGTMSEAQRKKLSLAAKARWKKAKAAGKTRL